MPYSSLLVPSLLCSNVQSQRLRVHIHRQHLDAVLPRVAHQLRRRIETHRLAVDHRGGKRGRIVVLEPRRCIYQQREARRVRLRETVLAEPLDLLIHPLGEFLRQAVGEHAVE